MNDKPMVIHTKKKPKLHIKARAETKIKGRNVLVLGKTTKITHVSGESRRTQGNVSVKAANQQPKRREQQPEKGQQTGMRQQPVRGQQAVKKQPSAKDQQAVGGQQPVKEEVRKSMQKEAGIYAQYRKDKKDREKAIGKKSSIIGSAAAVGAMTTLDQMEGGNEIYDSYRIARTLSTPAVNAADAGRRMYRAKAAKVKAEKIKKVQKDKKTGRKTEKKTTGESGKESVKRETNGATKETAKKAEKEPTKKSAKEPVKRVTKESAKKVAKEPTKKSAKKPAQKNAEQSVKKKGTKKAATARKEISSGMRTVIGATAGYAAGVSVDHKDMKATNRKLKFFLDKMNEEEKQKDSFAKLIKDLALGRVSVMVKAAAPIVGLFLLVLGLLVAVVAIPVLAVIAVVYNSPFAIFFPSISSGDTTQEVLSAYVEEFNRDVEDELTNHPGYDTSEKIYVNFEGAGTPDNYCDILAVYMVKYGVGDPATPMTDKAKQNLKKVFDDMCSYTIKKRIDTETDSDGNTKTTTVKEVRIVMKTYHDMILEYGFDAEEQEMLAELMKPEYMEMFGYSGGADTLGEGISPEQYQAIMDAVSDANGKKVVQFVLSKVGYPYSQKLRDSGNYYDCSSLAYYAWKNAGVNIMYEGANTAAAEGKYCYDHNYLVNYDEMQPGDLIFYSYGKNGRFFDITHVAVYVGDGKVVEAANERIGVVYRPVQGKSSIVFIGRPR